MGRGEQDLRIVGGLKEGKGSMKRTDGGISLLISNRNRAPRARLNPAKTEGNLATSLLIVVAVKKRVPI